MQIFDDIRAGLMPGFDELYPALLPTFPLLAELRNTPQDPEWHAEGDVHIHTSMVVEQIYRVIAEYDAQVTPDERLALVLGAALHDIGKPLTTSEVVIDGRTRIAAKRHDDHGRSYVAFRIAELGLAPDVAANVLQIIGHHHDPKRLLRKNAEFPQFRRLARLASLERLYLAELADMRGRTCADKREQLEIVDLFRLEADGHDLFGVVDPYAGWQAEIDAGLSGYSERTRAFVLARAKFAAERGEIVMPAEEIAKSYGYREEYSHLVVLCGPSGSGKSRWIAENVADYDVVSLDDLREETAGDASDQRRNGQVRQRAQELLRESLRAHRNVVWDATNLRRDFRRVPIELGYDYRAFVTLVVLAPTPQEARRNNASRRRQVPADVLTRQFETAQFPYADEAHEVVFPATLAG